MTHAHTHTSVLRATHTLLQKFFDLKVISLTYLVQGVNKIVCQIESNMHLPSFTTQIKSTKSF